MAIAIDGQKCPDSGIAISRMTRLLPSISVSLLSLCWKSPASLLLLLLLLLLPRSSEPPLADIFLEQCRQRSLDPEDQYDRQDVVCECRYIKGHVGECEGY